MMRNHGRGRGQVWGTLVLAFAAAACDRGNLAAVPDGGDAQPNALACDSLTGTVSWALTPDITQLTGTVTRKASPGDGTEELTIIDSGGTAHRLALNIGLPTAIATGDQVDVNTAVYTAFRYYRTLDVQKNGASVLYATEVAQPSLPPPLALEVGDSSCPGSPPAITIHQLRASDDGGEPVVIDRGQQAQVGRFRVFNDLIVRFPPAADDATDMLQIVVVRSP